MRRKNINILIGLSAAMIAGAMTVSAQESITVENEVETEATEEAIVGLAWDAKTDVTAEEQEELSGIRLPAPQDAANVVYNVLLVSDDRPMAETVFELSGQEYYIRAQATDLIELAADDERSDISGLYYDWSTKQETEIQSRKAVAYCCDEAGYITWIDAVPGILYNLGTTEKTDVETLTRIASESFVPLQGNAMGDKESSGIIIGGSDGR